MPRVSLVVTDLDGTLWDREQRVHSRNRVALAELKRLGVPVLAATARRPTPTRIIMEANDVLIPGVFIDGALGRDLSTNSTFHRHVFDRDTAVNVLGLLRTAGIEPCVTIDHDTHDVVVGSNPSTHTTHLEFIAPWLHPTNPDFAVEHLPVFSFLVCGREHDLLVHAQEAVSGLAATSVARDLTHGDYTLSVRPHGINKWSGVLAYCGANDLDPSRVLAVGDGENDVEMLRSAAIACAVADGCNEVLQLAHHRVGPAHEGGWADIVGLCET